MARPLRYEAAGAVYHVMARGDGGKNVFADDKDGFAWVDLLERACTRFGWRVHAWVLMGNHFHLLVETPEAISKRVRKIAREWCRTRRWRS
jgi:putative transposase